MPLGSTKHKLAFKGATIMTGLRKFGTKDMSAIVDAVERYSVGYDDLFYRLHSFGLGTSQDAYPPYNLVKETETKWRIELALAGWSKDLIEITTQTNVLIVRSIAAKTKNPEDYMHRGISTRTFAKSFNLSDDVEVGEVKFDNGLLTIELIKIVPDHQKRKVYDIK
jgi:molecular chaperone IbpA